MKKLSNFLHKPHLNNYMNLDEHSKYDKKYYVGDNELILSKYVDESSFEDFINKNNITEITEDTYRFYLDNNFNDYEHCDTFNGRWYSAYQSKLNETLLHSYDAKELVNKITKLYNIEKVYYVNPKQDITQFTVYLSKEDYEDAFTNVEFHSIYNMYNYYWKTANDSKCYIIFEPYKSKEVTDYIYNECNGIIYTITGAEIYNKINNSKELTKHILKPNKISRDNLYRDGRIFFICSKDKPKVLSQLQQIGRLKEIKFPVILKIDLNKYRHKLIFRKDSSANGYDAYFTEEPIPSYCISVYDNYMNEIDKETLNKMISDSIKYRKNF